MAWITLPTGRRKDVKVTPVPVVSPPGITDEELRASALGVALEGGNVEELLDFQRIDAKELLMNILIELKTMNYYLHEGLNIHNDSQGIRNDFEREVGKIVS